MENNTDGRNYLSLAFLLGAIPLVTGCGIFLLWCATAWDLLQLAGILNILFGLLLVTIGSICLIRYLIGVSVSKPFKWRSLFFALVAAVVLLINFPACGIIMDTVFRLENMFLTESLLGQSTIRIINASDSDIHSIDVTGLPFGKIGTLTSYEGRSIHFDRTMADNLAIQRIVSGKLETLKLPASNQTQVDIVVILLPHGESKIVSLDPRVVEDFLD
jgi:hypothetical protein